MWGCADGNGVDPRLVFHDRATAEEVAGDTDMVVRALYAHPPTTYEGEAEAVRHLTRLVRVYGDMQDGNGNKPTEIRHAERFLQALQSAGEK